eukprot:7185628-Pyramimonas_sp.AAC.1
MDLQARLGLQLGPRPQTSGGALVSEPRGELRSSSREDDFANFAATRESLRDTLRMGDDLRTGDGLVSHSKRHLYTASNVVQVQSKSPSHAMTLRLPGGGTGGPGGGTGAHPSSFIRASAIIVSAWFSFRCFAAFRASCRRHPTETFRLVRAAWRVCVSSFSDANLRLRCDHWAAGRPAAAGGTGGAAGADPRGFGPAARPHTSAHPH